MKTLIIFFYCCINTYAFHRLYLTFIRYIFLSAGKWVAWSLANAADAQPGKSTSAIRGKFKKQSGFPTDPLFRDDVSIAWVRFETVRDCAPIFPKLIHWRSRAGVHIEIRILLRVVKHVRWFFRLYFNNLFDFLLWQCDIVKKQAKMYSAISMQLNSCLLTLFVNCCLVFLAHTNQYPFGSFIDILS